MAACIVLLDTNFLLIPGQFGVDVFSELVRICDFPFEPAVLAETLSELERLADGKAAAAFDRRAAKLGIRLIKARGVRVIGTDRKVFKSADKAILGFAEEGNKGSSKPVIVATQDRVLKGKLASRGVRLVVLRQRQRLVLQ